MQQNSRDIGVDCSTWDQDCYPLGIRSLSTTYIIRARTYEYKTENASSILELGRPRRSAVNTNFCIRVPGSQNPVTVLVRRNADVATAGMVGDQQQMKSYQVLRIL